MMEISLIEEAYRKLKGSVYWDKTQAYLRTKIVEFEDGDYENCFKELLSSFLDDKKWNELSKSVLDSIGVYTFPKKVEETPQINDEPVVISNITSNNFSIEEYNNFIDISVVGHIVGVLWILLVGHKIDSKLSDACKGNRLCDTLIFRDGEATKSPNLFKPYYEQYSSWRNQGLDKASESVKNSCKSVVISMLDLTRYYYNVRFNKSDYINITKDYISDDIASIRVNELVFEIISKYSKIIGVEDGALLPIGFLPSGILANVYLDRFDKLLSTCKETIYYGRYVDDIILVTEINNDELKFSIQSQGISAVATYMQDYLCSNNIFENKDGEYRLFSYDNLKIKKSKLRFFYLDKDGHDIVIETIKRDIAHNTSEFHFLPEDTVNDLYESVIKLERDDTINKIRGIREASVDKYELSKAIGKNIFLSAYADSDNVNEFIDNLEHVLNHREIIRNYLLWEDVLNYLVVNDRHDELVKFSTMVVEALLAMDENKCKTDAYEYLQNSKIQSVKDTLLFAYYSSFVRATSIIWGQPVRELLNNIVKIVNNSGLKNSRYSRFFSISNITKMRRKYCDARMIRKSLIPVTIEECMAYHILRDTGKLKCFYKLSEYFNSNSMAVYSQTRFTPYILTPFDILYGELLKSLRAKKEFLGRDSDLLEEMFKKYSKNFDEIPNDYFLQKGFDLSNVSDKEQYIIIKSDKKKDTLDLEKVRIAIANVQTKEEDFIDILDRKKRNLSERCETINTIVNEAIREHSTMLVFPEAFIPLEYLQQLQKKVANSNMIIVGGVEHIRQGNKVYNITATVVPITLQNVTYSIPFFHAKRYYSPEEEKLIFKRSHCTPVKGTENVLYEWNGIRFVTYCCYELTSILLRAQYIGKTDLVIGVEWNKDVNYFSNIIESLCRDLSCFCVQANVSEYGDSRIVQPTLTKNMDIVKIKGGVNSSVIIGEVNIKKLKEYNCEKTVDLEESQFKQHPAGWN